MSLGPKALREATRNGRLASIRRRGWQEGVLGGRRGWQVAGGIAWGVWLLQRAWRRESELVYRTRLQAGQKLQVSVEPPRSRKLPRR